MEAVPRMPMLAFELKHSPEYVEFGPTLKKYIREHYGEDPAHYNKSCNELESLRQSAVHVSHDFMGCSTLKKYYAQLQFLQGRFPMTEGAEASIPFTWEEVHSGREICYNDIKFEQACILYNIGALHSILGAMDTRQSADGMKVSCTHFQCASWAFEYLRDHFGCAAMSLDMSHELLTFHVHLMLAQAQECILEKSMTDSRKSTITAKVAAQIVEFYVTSLKHLDTINSLELISSKRYKDWKKRMDIKVLFYTCITHYYMGRQSEEQQKWGQCLAYYTLALDKLTECEKMAKNESADILDSLRFTHDVVGGKHQSAKKDNDFVYHDKIPATDSLPEVKGATLVKGIPFNANDPEISGPDIFTKLVPMSAHEAASLYSEEKASLLRRVVSEITEKNEELTQYLASLQLDQTSLNPEPERLPQQLLEKCAALSVRPTAIKELVDAMTAVSNVATEVEMGIQEIQQTLQDESKAELEYQEMFGKRNPNAVLSEIAQECARLEEGHKKGNQSNQTLHKAMNTHISNLKLLSSPLEELQNLLPSVDKDRDAESSDVIKQLNMLLAKIEEMRTQRQTLEDQLRKDIMEDDITGALCKQESANRDVLFSEQLKKHDKMTGTVRQNLSAQTNILRALTDANSKYASVRRATSDALSRREQMIRDLINSYDVYEDLKGKSQKGLEFYKKLETNVGRLLTRCRAVCQAQQEEREKMYNKYKPKAAPTVSRPQAPKPGQTVTMEDLPPLDRVTSPADMNVEPTGLPTLPAMFDGPKLKDYLPFMKPKTFGKKDGSPPVTGPPGRGIPRVPSGSRDMGSQGGVSLPNTGVPEGAQDFMGPNRGGPTPNVGAPQGGGPGVPMDYMGPHAGGMSGTNTYMGPQGGSLPNSATASPVHLPHSSGSMPASPDHFRQRFDGRLGPADRRQPQQPGPDFTQGGQGHIGQGHMYPGSREPSQSPSPSPSPRFTPSPSMSGQNFSGQNPNVVAQYPNMDPSPSGQGQGMMTSMPSQMPSASGSEYVPLDQKWKREKSALPGNQSQMVSSQGPPGSVPYSLPQQTPGGQHAPASMAGHQALHRPAPAGSPAGLPGDQMRQGYGQYSHNIQMAASGQPVSSFAPTIQPMPPHMIGNQGTSMPNQMPMSAPLSQPQFSSGGSYASSQMPSYPMASSQHIASLSQRDVTNTVSASGGPMPSLGPDGQTQGGHFPGHSHGFLPHGQQPSSSMAGVMPPGQMSQQPPISQYQGSQSTPASQGQGNFQQQGSVQSQLPASQPFVSGQSQPPQQPANQTQFGQQTPSVSHQQQLYGTSMSHTQTNQNAHTYTQQGMPTAQAQGVISGNLQQHQQFPQQQQQQQPQFSQQQQQLHQQQPGQQTYQSQSTPGQQVSAPNLQQFSQHLQQQGGQVSAQQSRQPQIAQVAPNQFNLHQQPLPLPQSPQMPHQQGTLQPQGNNQTLGGMQSQVGNQPQGNFQPQGSNQTQRGIPPQVGNQPQGNVGPQGLVPTQGTQQPFTQQQGHGMPYNQYSSQGQTQMPTGSIASIMPKQQPQQAVQNQQEFQQQQQGYAGGQVLPPQQKQSQQNFQSGQQAFQPGQAHQGQFQQPGQGGFNMSNRPTGPSQVPHSSPLHSVQQPQNMTGPRFSAPNSTGVAQSGQQTYHFTAQGNAGIRPPMSAPHQQFQQTPTFGPQSQATSHQPVAHQQNQLSHGQRPPVPSYTESNANRTAQQQSGHGQVIPTMGNQGSLPHGQQGYSQSIGGQQSSYQGGQMAVGQPRPPLPQHTPSQQPTGTMQPYGQPAPMPGHQSQTPYGNQQQGFNQQTQSQNQTGLGNIPPILQPQVLQPSVVPAQKVDNKTNQPTQPVNQQTQNLPQGQGQVNQPQVAMQPQVPIQPQAQPVQPQGTIQPQAPFQPQGHSASNIPSGTQTQSTYPQGAPRTASPVVSMVTQQSQNDRASPVETRTGTKLVAPVSVDRQLSTASSLDEILSSSPDNRVQPKVDVLAPKVMTAQELQQQKEDLMKTQAAIIKDPYKDQKKLDRFVVEVEKLAKFIEGCEKPSCSGPTPLDSMWKELQDEQDKAVRQQKLAIARCYPMKNRDQDIMPYDNTRVLLTTMNDDYINASWVNDLSPTCPKFIATQAPLPVTLTDFWLMVCEQGVEVLVALSCATETGKRFPAYVPSEKGETLELGPVLVTVQTVKKKPLWTERILYLKHHETKTGRTLVHLHYNGWPVSGFPDKTSHLLQFITEVHSFYRQQRSLMKPVLVHCGNGVGRTGMFQLIYVGMQVINHGQGIVNVQEVATTLMWKRRNLLIKPDQLKFCFDAILYYAQDILAKEGILVHKASFGDQLPKPGAKPHGWEPGEDILFGSLSFTNLQTNVAKLGAKKSENQSGTGSEQKHETSLDEKLEMLKSDGNLQISSQRSEHIVDKTEDKLDSTGDMFGNLDGSHISAMLPDVVQNPGITLERKLEPSTVMSSNVVTNMGDKGQGPTDKIKDCFGNLDINDLKMGENGSGKSSVESKGSKHSSVTASPAHGSREVSSSPKPEVLSTSSLAELQDPSKFTIGKSEAKKKIKKSDFEADSRVPVEPDPNDPIGNLDPFWSLK